MVKQMHDMGRHQLLTSRCTHTTSSILLNLVFVCSRQSSSRTRVALHWRMLSAIRIIRSIRCSRVQCHGQTFP